MRVSSLRKETQCQVFIYETVLETVARQYQPIEFRVPGGLLGNNNSITEQYTTGNTDATGGYTTTKTTTTRTITSADLANRSPVRGIRPFEQVDLVLQPDTSLTSTSASRLLTTSSGFQQEYSPYFSVALNDQTVREGESVIFEIKVSGKQRTHASL
jgi:hypothetical protein